MTKLTVKNLYRGDAIDAKIEAFHKRGQSMQAEAHKLAVSTLLHVATHKNVAVVHKLLQAMPDALRTNGLRAWFEHFGPVVIVTEGEGVNKVDVITYKAKQVDMQAAIDKPFWKFTATEGKPYEALDVNKAVNDLVKKLRTDATKTGADHSALITQLLATINPTVAVAAPVEAPADVDPLTVAN